MGKSLKDTKTRENKNGKCQEREGEMEKNQEKIIRKRKSFWAKLASLFSKQRKEPNVGKPWRQIEQETQIPRVMINKQPLDIERWRMGGTINVNSRMLNIPIEPGRQLSTIMLSTTKTGFKAVIAHNGINSDLAKNLTKDLNNIPGQFDNRRTLTLVFDMNMNTFTDASVGRSDSTLVESKLSESEKNSKNMSASAIFVRTGDDEVVESAGFLQAQLSLDNPTTMQAPILLPEEMVSEKAQRPISCRNLPKSRVAFKTSSEPMWREKQNMRKEMVIKQNIQEVLNQFIFLDQDDSLMNYPRFPEENLSRKGTTESRKPLAYEDSSILGMPRQEKEDVKPEHLLLDSKMSFSLERLSQLTSSTRNVAPDLLVNIKPFKQRISGSKRDFTTESNILRSEKTGVLPKKTTTVFSSNDELELNRFVDVQASALQMLGSTMQKITSVTRPKEYVNKVEPRLAVSPNRNRLSICIKCGVKAKGGEPKLRKDKMSSMYGNSSNRKDEDSGTDLSATKKNSVEKIKDAECTLCSTWKMYNKKCFGNVNLSNSIEHILEEFKGYDHNSIFRRNLPQFRRKIKPNGSPADFESSHSSLSFAEVLELEEGKLVGMKNSKQSNSEPKPPKLPNVTLRLIEFVWKSGEKTFKLERIQKSAEKLETRDFMKPSSNTLVMENLTVVCNFRWSNKVKIEAQKIEEILSTRFVKAFNPFMSQETMMVIRPAYTDLLRSTTLLQKYSEDQVEDSRGSFSRRAGQIPDVINHLWMEKIEDLRNELLTRMNETRVCYDPSKFNNSQIIRLTGIQNATNRCSAATKASHILSKDGASNECITGFNNSVRGAEIPEKSETYVRDRPTSSAGSRSQGMNVDGIVQDKVPKKPHAEDPQSTHPNDRIILTNPDLEIHSCLTFFEPFVQQIQTVMQILNSAPYSFAVRKMEDQVNRNRLRILKSCTLLSDKKKFFIDNELESLVLKKCIEKNVVSGATTLTTSKKEIMTIKGSKSGNHLLVTNKKILTTSDRIKRSDGIAGQTERERNEKNNNEGKQQINLSLNTSKDVEDVDGVHCLYYKQTDGHETSESSDTSNSEGKICESQSSIIAISELEDNRHRNDIAQVNESETSCCEQSPMKDEILHPNLVNDSLQEAEREPQRQLLKNAVKICSAKPLEKKTHEEVDENDQLPKGSGSVTEDLKIQSKVKISPSSNGTAIQSTPSDSHTKSDTIKEELTINEEEENVVVTQGNTVKNAEEVMKNRRLMTKNPVVRRGTISSQTEKPNQAKHVSVMVALSGQMPPRRNFRSFATEQKAKEVTKPADPKCLDVKPNDISKNEALKNKLATRNRKIGKTIVVPRKKTPDNQTTISVPEKQVFMNRL